MIMNYCRCFLRDLMKDNREWRIEKAFADEVIDCLVGNLSLGGELHLNPLFSFFLSFLSNDEMKEWAVSLSTWHKKRNPGLMYRLCHVLAWLGTS